MGGEGLLSRDLEQDVLPQRDLEQELLSADMWQGLGGFDEAFQKVIGHEGGYVDDPNDPGGETKFGIAKKYNPDVDIKNLDLEGAKKLYKERYWDKYGLSSFPAEHQADLFDMVINSPSTAAKAIQRVVGAKDDGIIGTDTRKKMSKYKGDLGKESRKEYVRQLSNKSGWKHYGNGWANRYLGTDVFGKDKIDVNEMTAAEFNEVLEEF